MSFSPDENGLKSLISVVRSTLTSQPPANPGDTDAPAAESGARLWRRLLRHLPRDLEYVYPDSVIDEHLKCPVCLSWPTDPVVLGCPAGHLLCRSCASSLREPRCPLDRQHFATTSSAEQHVLARLDHLHVRCPYAAAGCAWTGERGHLLQHCSSCDQAVEECRQCGAHVRRREQAGHRHAFEVGAWVRCAGRSGHGSSSTDVGEVVRADAISDVVMVRFAEGVRQCSRGELVRVRGGGAGAEAPTADSGSEDPRPPATSERRQAQIDNLLNVYEQAERLNTCFLVDCTGSMSPHLQAVKGQILGIVREMSRRLPTMQLHIAFVGYRDHGDANHFEVCPFTTSVESFRDFVGRVGAFGCGGDIPEDVLGGLQQTLNLEWGIGGAATRVLIHIGDAPCHGTSYHDSSVFRHRDNYPQGDPNGLQASSLLRSLQEKHVQYIFGRINQTTDKMIRMFDAEAGGGFIQTREMRDTRLVAEAVTSSLHSSVATTVSTLSSLGRAPNHVETSDDYPFWSDIIPISVKLHRCALAESIADLRKEALAGVTQRFEVDSARVQLAKLPFSQGETRAARHALLDGSRQTIAKHMKATDLANDHEAEIEEASDDGDGFSGLDEFLCLSEVSAVAAFLGEQFSAEQGHGSKIRFLEALAVVPLDGSKPFNLEQALPADEFRRFSNNIGWWEPDTDELLMRFMRWTHQVTEGHMMVVDLQGVRTEEGFLLTDPCILCADVTRFGSGNLGPRAMERCIASLAARLDRPPEEPPAYVEAHAVAPTPVFPLSPYDSTAPFVPDKLRWSASPVLEEALTAPCQSRPYSSGGVTAGLSKAASAISAALGTAGMQPVTKVAPATALDAGSVVAGLLVPSAVARTSAKLPSEQQIKSLLSAARSVLLAQPALLEIEAPINIVGDIHGQFGDMLRYFDMSNVEQSSYLFLGDYVDRGKQSLEVMTLLLALKVKRPENIFLLRGNHECASITRIYGFYDECKRRFNIKLWKQFCDVFNCLPVAAVIDERIFCCHGGLSPELTHFDSVRRIQRPTEVPDTGLVCDLLWADPDKDISGWAENDRGVSYCFGADAAASFLAQHSLDLIVRAHQVCEDGYEFFANRRLVTVFSAVNYCGEFDNDGALMEVKDDLECSFKLLRSHKSATRAGPGTAGIELSPNIRSLSLPGR